MRKKILNIIMVILIAFYVYTAINIANASNENVKSENVIKDGTYSISSALNSNLVLDVEQNSMQSGANISIWQKNNQNNQKFRLTYMQDGFYKIEVVSSGKVLTGTDNKNNVEQNTYSNSNEFQKWIIKDAGDGYYYIIAKANSLCLDIFEARNEKGTNVELYKNNNQKNQKFKFNKVNEITGKKTIENNTYTISSGLDFNSVIDITGVSTAEKANAEIYTRNGGKNQNFKIEYLNDGFYKIEAEHSGKALTVKDSSIKKEANVQQEKYIGIDSQKWVIKEAGDGYYYIISKCNGLYLDLKGGTATAGTNLEVYESNSKPWQKFKFYSYGVDKGKTIESGNYIIQTALNTSKLIDVTGDTIKEFADIELWQNNNQNNQKFIVSYLNEGYYTIKAFNSNKVLTVKNSSFISGAKVVQANYKGLDSQKWAIQQADNGYYFIVNKLTGFVLDIEGANSKNGTKVEVYLKNNGNNQKFKFTKTTFSATISNGKYAILASQNNNKAMDIEWASTENGSNLQLWDSNGGVNQSFNIEYQGDGYYTIEVMCSRKLLTVKNGNIIQQELDNSDEQKWIIQKADDYGNYAIRSKKDDKYIDIKNNNMTNGNNIGTYAGNNSNAQKFKLEELLYKGIDVSKYQYDIDWNKVKTQIDFSMIRVGFRGYTTGKIIDDTYYEKNITEAIKNHIKCGVYFFTQAINETEAIEEAEYVINKISKYDIDYPVAIDTEWTSEEKSGRADWISKEERTKVIKSFCQKIKEAGYTPIIYASKDWIKNQLNIKDLSMYDIWLAHYVSGAPEKKSDYNGVYSMWQYTSLGKINGINGNVDLNLCYKKYTK